MNDNSTFISPQEKILYKEIESYRESQKQLKNIIENIGNRVIFKQNWSYI